jgi:site-specific DNA-methyltransferase (adenine-specific)
VRRLSTETNQSNTGAKMILNANALAIPLADQSVQCVVTSPPYYGLRDYGIDEQIGLEVTPDEYIANLVAVFRECKRILRDDGTLWVNIGDSYNGSAPNQSGQNGYNDGRENRDKRYSTGGVNGLKPKDLIGIPWMLAFALRADGWYLRQDIIWAKPNPMPESVKDRCTKSHEYIFLLSKSARYYYDNDAVKEPSASPVRDSNPIPYSQLNQNGGKDTQRLGSGNPDGRNKRDVWTVTTKPYKGAHYATFNPELIKPCILAGAPEGGIVFDPFVGSGTTVATAIQLGRKGIGLDLSLTYLYENAKDRIEAEMLPLLTLIGQD